VGRTWRAASATSISVKPVRSDKKASDPLLHEGREGRFDITFDNSFDDNQFTPNRIRRRLHICADGVRIGIGRILKHADDRRLGHRFVQHLKLLCWEFTPEEGHARDVAARPRETGDKPILHRIGADFENNRDCCGGGFRGVRRQSF
jgi:hypothetical protein